MEIVIIAAVAANRAIGYNNKLIYHFKEDLAQFKALTTGNTVLMGRMTYESLPNGALPNRRNIVVSKSCSHFPDCDVFGSIEDALAHCTANERVFIIGGESIYRQTIGIADRLFITEIDDTPTNADSFFPEYNDWTIYNKVKKDGFAFVEYIRNK